MKMKKLLSVLLVLALCVGCMTAFSGCKKGEKVVIYSSDEDYINEYFLDRLKKEFPDYNITIDSVYDNEDLKQIQ